MADLCDEDIIKAAGGELEKADLDAIKQRAEFLRQKFEKTGLATDADAQRILNEDIAARKEVTLAAKRQKAINARVGQVNYDYVTSVWKDNPVEGIKALIAGSQTSRVGARDSVANRVDNLRSAKASAFTTELEAADLVDIVRSGEMDLDMRKAALALDTGDNAALKKLPKVAVELAQIFKKHLEVLRQELNGAGSWIGQVPGYIGKQSHDKWKIAKAAGWNVATSDPRHFETWKRDVYETWDLAKTFPDLAPEEYDKALKRMFGNLSTGVHQTFKDAPSGTGKGFRNIAKRSAYERTVEMKEPEAEQQYTAKYGQGSTLFENVFHQLHSGGRDLAILRKLGPNAEANLDRIVDRWAADLHDNGRDIERDKMMKAYAHEKKTTWKVITGSMDNDDSYAWAAATNITTNLARLADLGMIVPSSVGDLANTASVLNQHGDRTPTGFFGNLANTTGHMLGGIGGLGMEKRELAAELGLLLEHTHIPHSAATSSISGAVGQLTKAVSSFFKYTGAQWMTNNIRVGSALATGSNFAQLIGKDFGEMRDGPRSALEKYGISEAEWKVLKAVVPEDYKGQKILTSANIAEIPESLFPAATDAGKRLAKEELVDKYRNMVLDISNTAATVPTSITRAIATQGMSAGSWQGFALRHALYLKSYTIGFMQRHLGRELHGYHPDRVGTIPALARAIANPTSGPLMGLTGLIAASMFMGGVTDIFSQISQGKEPMLLPKNGAEAAQMFSRAFQRSGAIGLYGDLIGAVTKDQVDGNAALINLLGPNAKRVADVLAGVGHLAKGDMDKFYQSVYKLAWNTTPGRNIWYSRWLTDYLINYNISEWLNPGYTARIEDRARQNGTPFMQPPSSIIKFGGGLR